MNKAELVAALAARLGQSKAAAASVLDAVLVTITRPSRPVTGSP